MKKYENKYGFTVKSVKYVPEADATVVDMTHDKSGAKLIFLDRRDENATFTIGFRTTPTDDTGVFHIIEHSVLCGSKKFPIKDPFTELLKGSVSTYLNALTSGDKTLYPVSSKNPKAFKGLVDVYLDAVFNPLALDNPFIFMQEGHRYELDETGELSITGVVYNEMKGVYSSADEYADYLISRQVCPGSTYSYDAGGNPDFIPYLTYDDFKRAHDKFYHPSNAYIFLDGDVVTDEILPLIDSYLKEYEKREMDVKIDNGAPTVTEPYESTFPIEKEEDTENKSRIYLCYNSYEHSKRLELACLSLVTEALADLNTAPLTKRILDSGLCESFNFYPTRSYSVNALNVSFIGVEDGKEQELLKVFDDAIEKILSEGISKQLLSSALKRREFNVREGDYGTFPTGMVYMRTCLDAAMFDEDVADALGYESLLKSMRENLDTNYYNDILREVISSARATLILHPDPDFTEKKEAEEVALLKKKELSLTNEEKLAIAQENERFRIWQNTPNTEDELNTLPRITIDDLKTEPKRIPTDIEYREGCEIILHLLHTGGISYLDMFFDASDADEDEIHYLRLFTDMISEWDTEKHSVTELRSRIKNHLGAFYLTPHPVKKKGETKLYILLHASCLDAEKTNAIDIITEQLYSASFKNVDILKKNVKQLYTYSVETITSRGEMCAMIRDAAKHSTYDAVIEHLFGYEYHTFIKELARSIDERADDVLKRFESIQRRYFNKSRLTIGLTESDGIGYAEDVIAAIKTGDGIKGPSPITPIPKINEGIAVPSTVSFTARSGNLDEIGENLDTGAFSLIQGIASLEILWNEIRLKNGAYDTGFFAKTTGSVGCYSYRDPSPEASINYFGSVADKMDAFLAGSPDLLKYIIGVFGSTDTVTTPRNDGSIATKRHLSGKTHEDAVKSRKECLEATLDELKRLNGIVREVMSLSTFTVVAGRDELEKISEIQNILDI